MPVRLPGGRKRATPAERQWFAQKNTIKPCGADVLRIGLSATVGNPTEILAWLQGTSKRADG